jgi:Fic family protein
VIFSVPEEDDALRDRLSELDALRQRLGADGLSGASHRIVGLRRQWRAASAGSSIEIEGYRVPEDERLALASGERVPASDDTDRMALACYGHAMDHVAAMADDPVFRWTDRVVLDLHFDACSFQRDKRPGRYRTSGIEVTRPGGGPPAYVGPPAEDVPGLMREVAEWLESGGREVHVAVRAAMAHLHVVSVHPFADGNGRVARIVQSLALARDGVLAPEFLSIEEYLGRNTGAYYEVLQQVQGGRYLPERDARPWIRFCVEAHIEQARLRVRQLAEAGARWAALEALVASRGWPDRLVIALEQSLFGSVDRTSYAAEADVSAPSASNDLRRLVDAGLLVQRGRGRSTRYVAGDGLRAAVHTDLSDRSD